MNILILGSGGREHALAWAVAQNPACDELFVAPGNAGMTDVAQRVAIDPCDGSAIAEFCAAESIDFVVIGPEAPLAAGVADRLREAGILTFGPSAQAALLEASKAFTKEVCDAANAPTAAWARFDTLDAATEYVAARGAPIVVKADGLAAGKGVTVAMTEAEAHAALAALFEEAGAEVVIEEFMSGEEASLFVLTDGTAMLPLAGCQDHKRAFDGDEGPNTGGMGAYSPAPVLTDEVRDRAMAEIIGPTLAEMRRRGTPYAGVLYAGLMIEAGTPRLVEYNARFGDPEAQVLAVRLGAQLLDGMLAVARGELEGFRLNWAEDHAITVVIAAQGYPGDYDKGHPIAGLEAAAADPAVTVFHAGTTRDADGRIVSAGGRVLNVTARGASLREAREKAYGAVARIDWPGGRWRSDIGYRAL